MRPKVAAVLALGLQAIDNSADFGCDSDNSRKCHKKRPLKAKFQGPYQILEKRRDQEVPVSGGAISPQTLRSLYLCVRSADGG
jgi:hypothetical protein